MNPKLMAKIPFIGHKETCLNVYQKLRDRGFDKDHALDEAAELTGIPRQVVSSFLKEYYWTKSLR